MTGGFNVVIPVTTGANTRVVIRCPLPLKIAEDRNPGSIDEKLACEAATYIWMQENARLSVFRFSMVWFPRRTPCMCQPSLLAY